MSRRKEEDTGEGRDGCEEGRRTLNADEKRKSESKLRKKGRKSQRGKI